MKKGSATPSSLLSEFETETQNQATRPCFLQEYLRGFNEAERRDVYDAITNKLDTVTVSAIHRVLQKRGWKKNYDIIKKHRRYGCQRCGLVGKEG